MPTRTKNQNELYIGGYNVICDRCGFKMKNVDVRKTWDDLYVCRDCHEPRHPSDFQGQIDYTDDPSVPFSRPDTNANTSKTAVDGTAIETDNFVDEAGDADKELRVDGTPRMNGIQNWTTTLTANRQATFDSTSAVEGDEFTIYYTATETAFTHSVVGETTRASLVNYTAKWRYNGSAWQEKSYTPIGL